MLGQGDTQYSQFDSWKRINGNARLLEGGNSLNSLFLCLLCGEADNGPCVWPEHGRAGSERGVHRPQTPSLRHRALRKGPAPPVTALTGASTAG